MTTQLIQIPVRSFLMDPQNKAHVEKLIRLCESRFNLAARAWVNGNNSGNSEQMQAGNARMERFQNEAEAMLAPLSVAVDYPGLYPSFTVKGYSEHDTASAVLSALGHPRNWLRSEDSK